MSMNIAISTSCSQIIHWPIAMTTCKTAIVKLVSDLLWAMENQQVTAVMDLDSSAAFDMVDHEIQLGVLNTISD